MSGQHEISVVIPTFNRLHSITDCLQGLARQTLDAERFEVVVVDNGSEDGTFESLARNTSQYPFRLRILRMPPPNRGPAPARNFGVENAVAEIIAFTDSDCRPDEGWLAEGLKAFEDPSVAFATGIVDFKPEQRGRLTFFSRHTVVSGYEHPTYPTANAFYRKGVFMRYGGFQERLSFPDVFGQAVEAADTDLAWRIKDDGGRNRFIPQAQIYHEVQQITPRQWLMEPVRLFLVPALVKLHPAMRPVMLTHGVFFYRGSLFYYLTILLTLMLAFIEPAGLLVMPVLLLTIAVVRTASLKPRVVGGKVAQVLLNALRLGVMSAALLYGSVRFRALVL